MALLKIEDLKFRYNGAELPTLQGINLEVNSGEIITICGESGSGKSTLLKLLKYEIAPHGELSGKILFNDIEIEYMNARQRVMQIGIVMQNPDNQIVTDKVWHELAFGLESLGYSSDIIKKRVAEISAYFGITKWLDRNTHSLSGGEKQLLNLASVIAMNPDLLLLDEPTSQLDPISADIFIDKIRKLNREYGMTIVAVEHRLENIINLSDRIIMLDKGKAVIEDVPLKFCSNSDYQSFKLYKRILPVSARIYQESEIGGQCPMNIKEARNFIGRFADNITEYAVIDKNPSGRSAIAGKGIYFRYNADSENIIKDMDIDVKEGEIFGIVGGNGTGKTTLLKLLSGLLKPVKGIIKIWDKKIDKYKNGSLYKKNIAMLPQNPSDMFVNETVREELNELIKLFISDKNTAEEKYSEIIDKFVLANVENNHPYDLSGGEKQKLGLAKIMIAEPKILLLDEPSKGLDALSKSDLISILRQLKNEGNTIVIISHDTEFISEVVDRCAMLYDGELIGVNNVSDFFSENRFYTTEASRIAYGKYKGIATTEQLIGICKRNGVIYD